MSEYLKRVGTRLSGLGRAMVNAAITFAINVVGVLFLILQPFGKDVSKWISLFSLQ